MGRFLPVLTFGALVVFICAISYADGGRGNSGSLSIVGPDSVRQGDVVVFELDGAQLLETADQNIRAVWALSPPEVGLITAAGRFVGYQPGSATIRVQLGGAVTDMAISILPRDGLKGGFDVIGRGEQSRSFNSDLWLHGNLAYTGTWQGRGPASMARQPGNQMFVWDVGDPRLPLMIDTLEADARTVNDIKVRDDGKLAVISLEGSSDGLNGITLLDLQNPERPQPISRFTAELETGVHNVWIEGDFVYAVADGPGNGLRIIDVSDPAAPLIVARFVAETSFLHDVLVRDGLAFLSHWDAGLIILDVGNGIVGGSPQNPVEVSRLPDLGGQTHNAWFWPDEMLVFVGERDHVTPGVMHVVDVSDLLYPKEVASFAVASDTPHNFWLDEQRGILYAAWYSAGIRAIDVTGELLGDLEKQDREIASLVYGSAAGCISDDGTCTWAPQLHNGQVFLIDMNTGLWVLEPDF